MIHASDHDPSDWGPAERPDRREVDDYDDSVEARVARGVEFLDVTMHEWWKYVVVNELDMSDTCNCVLGQTLGWSEGDDAFRRWKEWTRVDYTNSDLGFDAYSGENAEWDELRVEWINAIARKQANAGT